MVTFNCLNTYIPEMEQLSFNSRIILLIKNSIVTIYLKQSNKFKSMGKNNEIIIFPRLNEIIFDSSFVEYIETRIFL